MTEDLIDDSEQILAVFHPVVSGYCGREVQHGGESADFVPGLGEPLTILAGILVWCRLHQLRTEPLHGYVCIEVFIKFAGGDRSNKLDQPTPLN